MILPEAHCESLLFQRYILISRVFFRLASDDWTLQKWNAPSAPYPSRSGLRLPGGRRADEGTLRLSSYSLLCKASSCCSFMTATTAMSQDLSYRQKTERNRLTELIRVQRCKKNSDFPWCSPLKGLADTRRIRKNPVSQYAQKNQQYNDTH